ncbi:DarT ssDNA thymidine ADP-ribosyltransferase family protein [Selenomonas sp. FOBRC9]|jgi:hypothetical protein|uniref:DarT ssDNA thymidine ADP-ribosyltransferase family protein n=1 Tax=Selenomonas sp. FOBRC9 TaxID=936573 RepID=UPI00055ACE2C|nr:DarT ssDNA thymidine ADP-ribosyltransferase family protein [Selenomonas sp. FOBRC9]
MSTYHILSARGVNRLCHFTKLQSFTHIILHETGILARDSIRQDTKNVTDQERYDGELDYVSCSIQYPNSWFLKKAMQNDTNKIFQEWVVLYINLNILASRKAKFCPCNASKGRGCYIKENMEEIESIFAHRIPTFQYPRTPRMLPSCPTDGQAEILIKDSIPRSFIVGIAVGNEKIAERIYAILVMYHIQHISIFIAPDVITTQWSSMIKDGHMPDEIAYGWPE